MIEPPVSKSRRLPRTLQMETPLCFSPMPTLQMILSVQLASQVDQKPGFVREEKPDEGIYKELVVRMEKLCDSLQHQRKELKPPADYPKQLTGYQEKAKYAGHDSTKPGILDFDIHPLQENYILSGGRDSKVVLLDHAKGSVVKKFEPFDSKKQKAITVARFVPGMTELYGLLGASDGSAGLWNLEESRETYAIKCHTAGITDLSFQPLNEYVAISSKDKSWSFHNLLQGVKLAQFHEDQEIKSIQFQPDGLMLLTGLKDGTIKLYDVRSHQQIAIVDSFKGELSQISFSNKGLNFAVALSTSDIARVFNLRKLGKEVYELKHESNVQSVCFDKYGQTLVTGAGQGLSVYQASKQWSEAPIYANSKAHENGVVSAARFSGSGRMLVSAGGEDRFLKVFEQ